MSNFVRTSTTPKRVKDPCRYRCPERATRTLINPGTATDTPLCETHYSLFTPIDSIVELIATHRTVWDSMTRDQQDFVREAQHIAWGYVQELEALKYAIAHPKVSVRHRFILNGTEVGDPAQPGDETRPVDPVADLDLDHVARALQLVDDNPAMTLAYYRDHWAENFAKCYRSLVRGLPSADDVIGILAEET